MAGSAGASDGRPLSAYVRQSLRLRIPQVAVPEPIATAEVGSRQERYYQMAGMYGPDILVRTLSRETRTDRLGNRWQYHSRSDHHSKVACWGIVFDLLLSTPLLRRHVEDSRVGFGINHKMRDFVHDRQKDLDVVICTPSSSAAWADTTLNTLVEDYHMQLSEAELSALDKLPVLRRTPVGSVLLALEAKAAMTAHQRALPRLYDELNSSHTTVHGASEQAIAAGFVMVNLAERYLSPNLNANIGAGVRTWSKHAQPRDARLVVDKVRQLPRRGKVGDAGYDALAIVVVDAANDGSDFKLVTSPPAPQPGDNHHYANMIDRAAHIYATRFKDL